MDKKRQLMQSNVASILNIPDQLPPAEGPAAASSEAPRFEARGRRRKPRTEGELAARRGQTVGDWDKAKSYTTSFVFDYDQYLEMEAIATEQMVSKKAALKALLGLGIEAYRKKGGF